MTTVSPDPVRVELQLASGVLSCPSCDDGTLGPWGWARRRLVGRGRRRERLRPRRARCRSCRATHVLLPATMLARRGDWAATIGRALELKAAGLGQRPIGAALGVSRSTVRGWLSRFAEVAETVRAHLTRWAIWLDPGLVRLEPSGGPVGDAVAAIVAAGDAAAVELGIGCRWQFASTVTGGRLLASVGGDNPERLRSEAAFAHLCGVAPIPASSGKTSRHRLNRGGDPSANHALYTIVMSRLRYDERTQAYKARRAAEQKSNKDIIRCLKRYVAREIYHAILVDLAGTASPSEPAVAT